MAPADQSAAFRALHHCESRDPGIPMPRRRATIHEPSAAELREEIEGLEAIIECRALEAAIADASREAHPAPVMEIPGADDAETDHETSLLLQRVRPRPEERGGGTLSFPRDRLHADVEEQQELLVEREAQAATADARHRSVQSRLERVQECVAQLRIGMAIQSAEHVREMESLGSAMLGPQALLDEFDGARVTRPSFKRTFPQPPSLSP